MFRIGSALYIPSYLSVILYRAFASKSGDGGGGIVIMSGTSCFCARIALLSGRHAALALSTYVTTPLTLYPRSSLERSP